MCFSASASFTASALLFLGGIATLRKSSNRYRMLAAIPLLFAMQQFFEGLVWLGIANNSSIKLPTYGFLFFVFMVWPWWIPFSIRNLASKHKDQKLLLIPFIAGIFMTIASFLIGMTYAITATIAHHHIKYISTIPSSLWIPGTICYLIATIMPFFVIKNPRLWLMGYMLAISYMITFLFYYHSLLSVWCFFTAILSIFIFFIIR
jgi:hypothetical protein